VFTIGLEALIGIGVGAFVLLLLVVLLLVCLLKRCNATSSSSSSPSTSAAMPTIGAGMDLGEYGSFGRIGTNYSSGVELSSPPPVGTNYSSSVELAQSNANYFAGFE
jgi:hypothetical protein